VIAPADAAKLLEDVIYERVRRHIDLRGLELFEIELFAAMAGLENEDFACIEARKLIDRALGRFVEDPDRYITFDHADDEDCALCQHADPEMAGRP
jgi:hypothetical protein